MTSFHIKCCFPLKYILLSTHYNEFEAFASDLFLLCFICATFFLIGSSSIWIFSLFFAQSAFDLAAVFFRWHIYKKNRDKSFFSFSQFTQFYEKTI